MEGKGPRVGGQTDGRGPENTNTLLTTGKRKWNNVEAVDQSYSVKKVFHMGVLRNFSKLIGKYVCRVSFLIKLLAWAFNFIKIETLAQLFSCEFCEIIKKPFFIEHCQWLILAMNTSGKYLSQIFMITIKSNTSNTEKLKSLTRHQQLKIIQKLWGFSQKPFFKIIL